MWWGTWITPFCTEFARSVAWQCTKECSICYAYTLSSQLFTGA